VGSNRLEKPKLISTTGLNPCPVDAANTNQIPEHLQFSRSASFAKRSNLDSCEPHQVRIFLGRCGVFLLDVTSPRPPPPAKKIFSWLARLGDVRVLGDWVRRGENVQCSGLGVLSEAEGEREVHLGEFFFSRY